MQEYKVNWSIYFEKTRELRYGTQIWDQEIIDDLFDSDDEAQCLLQLMGQGIESIGMDRLVDAEDPENDFQWEEGPYHIEYAIIVDQNCNVIYVDYRPLEDYLSSK
tara:strand:- start:350 stop:667 length:318 start_codon:yes stop_codon:yes gene_type:complete